MKTQQTMQLMFLPLNLITINRSIYSNIKHKIRTAVYKFCTSVLNKICKIQLSLSDMANYVVICITVNYYHKKNIYINIKYL